MNPCKAGESSKQTLAMENGIDSHLKLCLSEAGSLGILRGKGLGGRQVSRSVQLKKG